MGPAEWAMLLALAVLWGATFFFVEIALRDLPPFTLVLARVSLGAAILLAAAVLTGHPIPREARLWFAFLIMALFNNAIPFSLIFWGQTEIGGGLAAILNATTPLWTVLLAHVVTTDEKLNAAKLAGVLAGIAGVAAMVGPEAMGGVSGSLLGQLAVLAASVSYAVSGLFARRFKALPAMVTAGGQLSAATLIILPVVLAVDRPWTLPMPSAQGMAAVVGLAALSTALAYILFFRILARAGATNVLLVTFLVPVTALLLGILVLGEEIAARHVAGMALIGLGLAAIDGRPFRKLRRARGAA